MRSRADSSRIAAPEQGRRVLLVTPYFAPQTHAAMFRVHKLAKYLPQFGWKPYVVTTDTNYLYNENPALLDELPDEVEVHRARFIEPTLRGVRMALGGKDRTFAALKQHWNDPSDESRQVSAATTELSFARHAYQYVLERAVHRPDRHWPWRKPALRLARRLIREHRIPIVYTTSLPYTTHQIGTTLQEELGCRWVLDLRDPGTYSFRMRSSHDQVFLEQRRIERKALHRADEITVLSSAYKQILTDSYGPQLHDRIHFIPTGADQNYLPERTALAARGGLAFVGEYLYEYGDSFWRILRRTIDMAPDLVDSCRVTVIGYLELNRSRLQPILERYDLTAQVEFIDHLPQKELYSHLAQVRAGLVIPGPHCHGWNNFAKMVDLIALGVPALALVPDPSEARAELSRAGTGVFLDGDLDEAACTLLRFLQGEQAHRGGDPVVRASYTATAQARAFAELFSSVAHGRR